MPTNPTQPVDQDALRLTHAIALQESGSGGKPNYDAVGDNGTSHGAYQWQPGNYEAAAKEAGLDPNDRSPVSQDKVAYYQVKKFKEQGLDPGQIASKWNSGSPDNWKDHSGTTTINGKPIHYDTPAYVQGVKKYYQQLAPQTNEYNPKPYSNPSPTTFAGQFDLTGGNSSASTNDSEQGFLSHVASDTSKRLQEGSNALFDIPSALMGKGKQSVVSDIIQTGGAAGGFIGDVTNRVLEDTPILGTAVKGIEGLIGQGVGALANTDTGKAVISSVSDWAAKHPELSKDIGAGFNIVTAIPILKGLGVAKNVAMDATAQALKGVAEKGAIKDLTATAMRTKTGAKFLAKNPDTVKTLVDERALPEIENGKYITSEARAKLGQSISDVEDNELQPLLSSANSPAVSSKFPLAQAREEALANAKDALIEPGAINKMFDLIKEKYGDYPSLQQLNEAKRTVSKRISEAAFDAPEASANKLVRSSLQQSVEDGAKVLGLDDVAAINQKMARLIKAQDMLGYIDRKPVRIGTFGGLLKDAATAGGEVLGNSSGIPLAGAYIGREGGGFVAKKVSGLKNGILNRTGKDASRTSIKSAIKPGFKGLIGTGAQRTTRNP